MWDFRAGIIPLLMLAALAVWSFWLGRGGSMRAKQMREQLNVPEKDEMEHAASLEVPLEVDMHTGMSWYEAK